MTPHEREFLKKCYLCQETKMLGQFYKDRTKSDGYSNRCRVCDGSRRRKGGGRKGAAQEARATAQNPLYGIFRDCNLCSRSLPASAFPAAPEGGFAKRCKECYVPETEAQRDWTLRRTYGITASDYDAMLEAQGGCCAFCGVHATQERKRLSVDHDHDTGRVRWLLCSSCNRGLGLLGDTREALQRALDCFDRLPVPA